jgi:acyl carrier protein
MRLDAKALVDAAIDDVNAQFQDQQPIAKSPDTVLLGDSGVDSLALVNLIAAIEQQVQTLTGQDFVMVDESTFAIEDSPFRTVGALQAYLSSVVGKLESR